MESVEEERAPEGEVNLAYFLGNVDLFRDGADAGLALRYALIPKGYALGDDDEETWEGWTITAQGELGPREVLKARQLRSLRSAGFSPGKEDPVEVELVERVLLGASGRGEALPAQIVSTRAMPGWSKMAIPGVLLETLRRAGRSSVPGEPR